MSTFDVPVPFFDLPLFGLEVRVSGTATVSYSTSYGGFVTRAVDIDRQFTPTLHPKPAVTWTAESKAALEAEAMHQFDLRCREDVESAIGQDMEERGLRRAA